MSRAWATREVQLIEGEHERFAHVVKHLYRASEHWEHVVSGVEAARDEAAKTGCPPHVFSARRPDCDAVPEACRIHVLGDHEHLYAPAYREALQDAEAAGRFGRHDANGHGPGWAFVDIRGVYVIVGERRKQPPNVRTAYRVQPPRGDAQTTEDFFKAAVRRLQDKSSWKERST